MLENLIRDLVATQEPKVIDLPGGGYLLLSHKDLAATPVENYNAIGPAKIEETIVLYNLGSFLAYVNRFKNADSTIFVTPDVSTISKSSVIATAVIDYHQSAHQSVQSEQEERARWGIHTAKLMAAPSLAYLKLLNLHDKMLPQDVFARELNEIAKFSSSHAVADLMEIARTLSLTSAGQFQSFEDDLSGSVEFAYNVKVKASAGSQTQRLTVPSEIGFHVPVLDGSDATNVLCDFRYNIPDGPEDKVKLGIRIKDKTWIEKEALDGVAARIGDGTQLMTLSGTF